MNRASRSDEILIGRRKRSGAGYGWKTNEPEEIVMNQRAGSKSHQHPKSIREAGEEFHSQLLRHFENDRPDVRELEAEEGR